MKVTFETNRDNTRYTFYSLEIGSVFTIDKGVIIGIKTAHDSAFDLIGNKPVDIISGTTVHKLDAELIIHERAEGTGIY